MLRIHWHLGDIKYGFGKQMLPMKLVVNRQKVEVEEEGRIHKEELSLLKPQKEDMEC